MNCVNCGKRMYPCGGTLGGSGEMTKDYKCCNCGNVFSVGLDEESFDAFYNEKGLQLMVDSIESVEACEKKLTELVMVSDVCSAVVDGLKKRIMELRLEELLKVYFYYSFRVKVDIRKVDFKFTGSIVNPPLNVVVWLRLNEGKSFSFKDFKFSFDKVTRNSIDVSFILLFDGVD